METAQYRGNPKASRMNDVLSYLLAQKKKTWQTTE
jgi:hypothetical protein